jgi:hypothetical protein
MNSYLQRANLKIEERATRSRLLLVEARAR